MNKYILPTLMLLSILTGCDNRTPEQKRTETSVWIEGQIIEFDYDGHEYLHYSAGHQGSVCHKASCKYCQSKE